MTIILPYRPDILDGTELLYSLRSIDKYLIGFTNLIIIGKPPEWYNGEWVSAVDYPGHKQYTIYNKLLIACELNNVSTDFIMWNDDHFLLQPLHINDIKYWHNGSLKDEYKRELTARYWQAINNTIALVPDGFNYDIHMPIIYNKKEFKKLFSEKIDEICIKSYYCNALNIIGEEMTDCKINQLLSYEAIMELIKDKIFFSTSANGVRQGMIKVFNELYPEKSKWE